MGGGGGGGGGSDDGAIFISTVSQAATMSRGGETLMGISTACFPGLSIHCHPLANPKRLPIVFTFGLTFRVVGAIFSSQLFLCPPKRAKPKLINLAQF